MSHRKACARARFANDLLRFPVLPAPLNQNIGRSVFEETWMRMKREMFGREGPVDDSRRTVQTEEQRAEAAPPRVARRR